jgi:hypothetical protein
VIDPSAFANICRSVRRSAFDRLLADQAIENAIQSAERLAQADLQRRRNRLLRPNSQSDLVAHADLDAIEILLPAIRKPAFRLDAMGCFIIAPTPPRQPVDA